MGIELIFLLKSRIITSLSESEIFTPDNVNGSCRYHSFAHSPWFNNWIVYARPGLWGRLEAITMWWLISIVSDTVHFLIWSFGIDYLLWIKFLFQFYESMWFRMHLNFRAKTPPPCCFCCLWHSSRVQVLDSH